MASVSSAGGESAVARMGLGLLIDLRWLCLPLNPMGPEAGIEAGALGTPDAEDSWTGASLEEVATGAALGPAGASAAASSEAGGPGAMVLAEG